MKQIPHYSRRVRPFPMIVFLLVFSILAPQWLPSSSSFARERTNSSKATLPSKQFVSNRSSRASTTPKYVQKAVAERTRQETVSRSSGSSSSSGRSERRSEFQRSSNHGSVSVNRSRSSSIRGSAASSTREQSRSRNLVDARSTERQRDRTSHSSIVRNQERRKNSAASERRSSYARNSREYTTDRHSEFNRPSRSRIFRNSGDWRKRVDRNRQDSRYERRRGNARYSSRDYSSRHYTHKQNTRVGKSRASVVYSPRSPRLSHSYSHFHGAGCGHHYYHNSWHRYPLSRYTRHRKNSFYFFVDLGHFTTRRIPSRVYHEYVVYDRSRPVSVYDSADVLDRAYADFAIGEYYDSITYFNRAISDSPSNGLLYLARAQAHIAIKDYYSAYDDLMEGFSIVPEWGGIQLNLEEVYGDPENFHHHLSDLEDWVAQYPNDYRAHFVLGYVYYFQQNFQAAKAELVHTLAWNEGHEPARNLMDHILKIEAESNSELAEDTSSSNQ